MSDVKTLLITGAGGDLGTRMRRLLKNAYRLRLTDLKRPTNLASDEEFVQADLADITALEKAVAGVGGIVHFGGFAVEGTWPIILHANIVGCYNLFDVAHRNGVKRVVFASSNHAIGFYPRHRRIGVNEPVRPDSRYGMSKAFGEAVGALYAYKYGMRVTCIRIGNVSDEPADRRRLSIWLKPEDLAQLVRIGLDHPDIRHEIFYGVSDNVRGFWDNEAAFRYGYRPQGRSEDYRDAALAAQAKLPTDPISEWYQGGPFCSDEYDAEGDPPMV